MGSIDADAGGFWERMMIIMPTFAKSKPPLARNFWFIENDLTFKGLGIIARNAKDWFHHIILVKYYSDSCKPLASGLFNAYEFC